MKTATIKEIFTSIQGEGPYIGYKQLFIRFCGCNLNCSYCDTDFDEENAITMSQEDFINTINNCQENIHSVSLTGGEPLLHADFLSETLPKIKKKIYLETNGTQLKNLEKIIKYVDYVSMDIKLDSISGNGNLFNIHDEFLKICKTAKVCTFVKIVFNSNISDFEIAKTLELVKKYDIELILQPVMDDKKCLVKTKVIEKMYDIFNSKHDKVRLIPQTHKFLDII